MGGKGNMLHKTERFVTIINCKKKNKKGCLDFSMRKVIVSICIAGMLLGCVSCGSKNQPDSTQGATQNSDQVQTTQAVTLTELCDAVKEAYGENYLPEMPYEAEQFENFFGISSDLYEEFAAEAPMMSAHVDIFVAVKAKEGKAEEVEKALQTYQDNLVANSLQYPMNLGKVEGATLYRNGDYVFYFILGGYPDDVDEVDAQKAKELNQIGIDAIEGILGKTNE